MENMSVMICMLEMMTTPEIDKSETGVRIDVGRQQRIDRGLLIVE